MLDSVKIKYNQLYVFIVYSFDMYIVVFFRDSDALKRHLQEEIKDTEFEVLYC
jgi:hypothetical protein